MGREAKARAAIASAVSTTPVYWYPCGVCRKPFPSQFSPSDRAAQLEQFDVCQRCCVADIASLMRTHPYTVRMLPSVQALEGRPVVAPIETHGAVTKALFGERR